jgi:AbrB family looped-hinge helix DNA binding protein
MFETTTTSKGQIVIPSSLRRKFGIKQGTRIEIDANEKEGVITLRPITREYVHSVRGRYKGRGLLKALMTDKKKERAL